MSFVVIENSEASPKPRALIPELGISKPIAAISDPPAGIHGGNGCPECPPKRQSKISNQAQEGEADPEHLLLHTFILDLCLAFPAFLSRAKHIQRCNE